MKNTSLSVGKIRGLSSISNREGIFTILALDHRQSFLKMINPGQVESVDYKTVVEVKSQVVRQLGSHSSAVLLDPIYGAAQAISNGACPGSLGLIVALEESGYTGTEVARESSLLTGWSVSKAKRMGGCREIAHLLSSRHW
jgi:tagatose-1,6-bisphosphate aldolase